MKTITVKYVDTRKYIVTISQDDWAENPLDWEDASERGAYFVMTHRNYNLPNELDVDFDEFDGWSELVTATMKAHKNLKAYKFVDWYEHSGIAVHLQDSTIPSDRWDSGIVGVIFGESEDAIKYAFLNWQNYIEGSVYSVDIKTDTGLDIDALSGIYGDEGVKDFVTETIGDAEYTEEYA